MFKILLSGFIFANFSVLALKLFLRLDAMQMLVSMLLITMNCSVTILNSALKGTSKTKKTVSVNFYSFYFKNFYFIH